MDFTNVPVMWEPKEGSGKRIKEFKKYLERKNNIHLGDYWDLHKWSIENITVFWEELWHYMGVIYSKPYEKVIDLGVPMEESPEWFPGARVNYAENILRYRGDDVALIVAGEDRETKRVTYAQLYEQAKLYAAALRKMGIKKGDRVSCLMSNREEAIFAMLGTTSIGAIWLGALPLMGSQAILNRFKQVQPKVLFTVDRFPHNREEKEMLLKVREIAIGLPSLEKVIIVPSKPESKLKDISGIKNSCFLDDFLETGKNGDGTVPQMEFEQVPFSHPVFISYTSGTTGSPKALIHGFGVILSISRDFYLLCDFDRSHTWLSVSPVGWVSWNTFATTCFFGATIVVFEGVPFFLSPNFLWDIVDEFKISCMALSPSTLDEMERRECLPGKMNHLRSLKILMIVGGIVKPQNHDFVYKKIKSDIMSSSVYGLTELMVLCTITGQTLKIHRGEITAPSLAVDIAILDDAGKSLLGEMGEFVLNQPLPSLPLGLWNDTDGSNFKKTYFGKFPGKFRLGDLAIINPVTRGLKICGRSDGTMLARGCRFNSSEIYAIIMDAFSEVQDSLCVSQHNKYREERAVLFLKMKKGCLFNEDLARKVKETINQELSARHVPEKVLETVDIPYNMSGKKMEVTVKNIINGMPYNAETIINPESLRNFQDVPELQGY